MSHDISMESPRIIYRRHSSLQPSSIKTSSSLRVAEIAGGVTGNCAMVWCCFPYTIVNMLTLIVYKVPTSLCKKAIKRHRMRRLTKNMSLPAQKTTTQIPALCQNNGYEYGIIEIPAYPKVAPEGDGVKLVVIGGEEMENEMKELEKEMFKRFNKNGFWRGSARDDF
ncbi:hypothetical protein RND81_12G139700 [Saponaria officinalis]|uniref:Uncharacterized protein n=1 Tax=Saponaria officinalis TaxID=3572 RepID=A0AAW1HAC7_SAPOF